MTKFYVKQYDDGHKSLTEEYVTLNPDSIEYRFHDNTYVRMLPDIKVGDQVRWFTNEWIEWIVVPPVKPLAPKPWQTVISRGTEHEINVRVVNTIELEKVLEENEP